MSKSNLPIPAPHKKTALKVAAAHKQGKVYITEDGHVYLPANKAMLDYHCQTNSKKYWEVEAEQEVEVKAPAEDKADGMDDSKQEPEAQTSEQLSDDDQKKMSESAQAAGAPDAELVAKLKGLSVEKLSARTKDELLLIAAKLNISVTEASTKPVIAEAILQVINA